MAKEELRQYKIIRGSHCCLSDARCSPKEWVTLIRDYNDSYHKNKSTDDYLSLCIIKTIFTNDHNKYYVFVEDLGRNK